MASHYGAEAYGLRDPSEPCPACGAQAGGSAEGIVRQITRLHRLIAELDAGSVTPAALYARVHRMCGACQLMMIGDARRDTKVLLEQIRKSIQRRERLLTPPAKAA